MINAARPADGGRTRLAGLDLLRLLAVLLVLGRHLEPPPGEWSSVSRLPLETWIRGGWIGVDLFFVLSGFLVSGLLFSDYRARGTIGIGRFYMRRAWKIYPPFFVFIAVTVLLTLAAGARIEPARLAAEVLFIQSYLPGIWNHTWSLAVEEHFYVILPLVLSGLIAWAGRGRLAFRPVLLVGMVTMVGVLAMRIANWHARPSYAHLTHLFPTHLRLDALAFGVVIASAIHFHREEFIRRLSPWRRFLACTGAMLLVPAFLFQLETTPLIYTVGLTVFYLGSGMLLVSVLLTPLPEHRMVRALAFLGACSYSIYLWHMPVRAWGLRLLDALGFAQGWYVTRSLLYLAGSVVLGVAMAKLVEVPALRLRNRWFPAGQQRALQPTGPDGGEPLAEPALPSPAT